MMSAQAPQLIGSEARHQEDEAGITLTQVLTWLGEGKRLVAVVTLFAGLIAVTYALLAPDIYTARTTLLAPQSQQQGGAGAAMAALSTLGGLAGSAFSSKVPDELYVGLLKSDSVGRALAEQFDLKTRYKLKSDDDLRRKLPSRIRVNAEKKSGLITLEVDDEQPKFAAALANAHVAEVTKLLSRLAVTEAQQRRVYFEQQLKDTKERLIEAEQALLKTQRTSGMLVLDKQAEAIIQAVVQLKSRITEREIKLRVLRSTATAENPQVKLLSSELNALRAELTRMQASPVPAAAAAASAAASGASAAAADVMHDIDIPLGQLPNAAVAYVRAAREVKFQETMLATLLRQFEAAKMDESKEAPTLQQVDVANPPDRKSKPQRSLLVLSVGFAALLLSSTFVVWRSARRFRLEQNPEEASLRAQLARAWRWRR